MRDICRDTAPPNCIMSSSVPLFTVEYGAAPFTSPWPTTTSDRASWCLPGLENVRVSHPGVPFIVQETPPTPLV